MRLYLLFILSIFILQGCKKDTSLSQDQKDALIEELQAINDLDQQYAGIPPDELFEKYERAKAWEVFEAQRDSVGLINQGKIKTMFKEYGFLGYDKVGKEGSKNFWISVQHADNDVAFQQEILQAMEKEIESNNASKVEYAMLEDRVNVNLEKPQRFGSQVTYNEQGQAIPKFGLQFPDKVEELRAEYEMESFKDYYNGMTEMHFQMNKDYLESQGITEPVLYE